MSDVKITEQEGSLWVETPYSGLAILPPRAVAALREHFAAERMPEDVQKLVAEARSEDAARPSWEIALDLADALEAAYSRKGAVDDPR